jgi:hypothetical protein
MSGALLIHQPINTLHRHVAPVIHLLPIPVKKKTRKKTEKPGTGKLPHFYTEPIFRTREHDFL